MRCFGLGWDRGRLSRCWRFWRWRGLFCGLCSLRLFGGLCCGSVLNGLGSGGFFCGLCRFRLLRGLCCGSVLCGLCCGGVFCSLCSLCLLGSLCCCGVLGGFCSGSFFSSLCSFCLLGSLGCCGVLGGLGGGSFFSGLCSFRLLCGLCSGGVLGCPCSSGVFGLSSGERGFCLFYRSLGSRRVSTLSFRRFQFGKRVIQGCLSITQLNIQHQRPRRGWLRQLQRTRRRSNKKRRERCAG